MDPLNILILVCDIIECMVGTDIRRHPSGLPGSLPNADQCRSNCGIYPNADHCWSIPLNLALIRNDLHWEVFRINVRILISIGHWSRESWSIQLDRELAHALHICKPEGRNNQSQLANLWDWKAWPKQIGCNSVIGISAKNHDKNNWQGTLLKHCKITCTFYQEILLKILWVL